MHGFLKSQFAGQNLNATANPSLATTIAQLSCNFESQSICNYQQSTSTSTLQWKWQRGGTPSANTGPSSDHTTGTATGEVFTEQETTLVSESE